MPTLKDRVFVELALREGLCQPEKLDQIKTTQVELEKFGISKFVGAIVVEKNLAGKEDVAGIIGLLDGYLVRCASCGEGSPVSSCDRQGNLRCTRCKEPVEVPEGRLSEEQFWEGAPKTGAENGRSRRPRDSSGGGQARRSRRDPLASKSFTRRPRSAPVGQPEATRFQIRDLVGISSSGTLYRIVDNSNFGALKIIDSALYADRGVFKRWVEVMQRTQDLPRSATLKPTQLVRDGSLHYVVRSYVEPQNCSLRSLLSRNPGPSTKQVVGVSVAILNSLSTFHSVRLVQGNLRPENILLDRDAVLLTDPGVLILYSGLDPDERLLRLWDSRRYLAPEVLQGGEPTFASDVFSAGKVIEELLERSTTGSEAEDVGGKENDIRGRLTDLVDRMVAFDPAERPPTAKDIIRDLQKPKGNKSGSAPRSRRTNSNGVHRSRLGSLVNSLVNVKKSTIAGPALLVLALGWIGFLGWTWNTDRCVLYSGAYAEGLTTELFQEETQALRLASIRNGTSLPIANELWNRLVELYRGTSLETAAREAKSRSLSLLKEPRDDDARKAVDKAESLAREGRWIPALVTLLRCRDRLQDTQLWKQQLEAVTRGLRETAGLTYVPAGTVTLFVQGRESTFEVPPFLIDAEPVRRGSAERALNSDAQETAVDSDDAESPWVNVGLGQARKAANALKRRLPTLAEWTRYAEETGRHTVQSSASSAGEFSGLNPRSRLFEWVEEVDVDSLSKLGYGCCVGGARYGVAETHPIRRKSTYGYPDVGVRFVQELDLGEKR